MLKTIVVLSALAVVLHPAQTDAVLLQMPQSASAGSVHPHYVHTALSPKPKVAKVKVKGLTLSEKDKQIRNLLAQIELIKSQIIALQAAK